MDTLTHSKWKGRNQVVHVNKLSKQVAICLSQYHTKVTALCNEFIIDPFQFPQDLRYLYDRPLPTLLQMSEDATRWIATTEEAKRKQSLIQKNSFWSTHCLARFPGKEKSAPSSHNSIHGMTDMKGLSVTGHLSQTLERNHKLGRSTKSHRITSGVVNQWALSGRKTTWKTTDLKRPTSKESRTQALSNVPNCGPPCYHEGATPTYSKSHKSIKPQPKLHSNQTTLHHFRFYTNIKPQHPPPLFKTDFSGNWTPTAP